MISLILRNGLVISVEWLTYPCCFITGVHAESKFV